MFGVILLATDHLPNWWDLAVIAAFSLVIYYWAVHSTLPDQRVSVAVEQVRPSVRRTGKVARLIPAGGAGPNPEDPAPPRPFRWVGSIA